MQTLLKFTVKLRNPEHLKYVGNVYCVMSTIEARSGQNCNNKIAHKSVFQPLLHFKWASFTRIKENNASRLASVALTAGK